MSAADVKKPVRESITYSVQEVIVILIEKGSDRTGQWVAENMNFGLDVEKKEITVSWDKPAEPSP